jgi:IS1 family transposase
MLMDLSQFLKEQSWMNGKLLWAQKNKVWLWTAVDHLRTGILGWVIGEWLTPRYANG